MKIDWLKPLLGHKGPFATVYLDATRAAEAGDREVENRWNGVRRTLAAAGAPGELLDMLEESALQPSGHGPRGRVLVADADGVLVDRVLRTAPARNTGVWGPVPALAQAIRAADEAVDHVRVVVDRFGGDITRYDGAGTVGLTTVQGGHDDVNKVAAGRMSQRRGENRAEDSWERNAEAVAAGVAQQVAERRPELVILTGDVRAMALVRAELPRRTDELVVEVPGGSRAPGVRVEAFEARVAGVLESFRDQRRESVLGAYRRGQGRAAGAVTSIEDVVAVLGRSQVAELILDETCATDIGVDERTLWIGPDPLHIAVRRSQLASLGVDAALVQLPWTAALVRAALGQDAGVTFAPSGSVELVDGVGATLRWSDDATPRELTATMSRDRVRRRREGS